MLPRFSPRVCARAHRRKDDCAKEYKIGDVLGT